VIKHEQVWNYNTNEGETLLSGIRMNCLISGRRLLLYQFTKRTTELTVVTIIANNFIQHLIQYPPLKGTSMYTDGIISVGLDASEQLLIKSFAFLRYRKKMGVQGDSTSAVRNIGQGEARHRIYRRLKFVGGQTFERLTCVAT
jgi:hypothetical protein